MFLVVARVEGEGDDVGDRVDGEAREDDSGERLRERLPVGFLVIPKTASRDHLAEILVVGVDQELGRAKLKALR